MWVSENNMVVTYNFVTSFNFRIYSLYCMREMTKIFLHIVCIIYVIICVKPSKHDHVKRRCRSPSKSTKSRVPPPHHSTTTDLNPYQPTTP